MFIARMERSDRKVEIKGLIGYGLIKISGSKKLPNILAIYGSPRRQGNTATLLDHAVRGAVEAGAKVEKLVLRDLRMSPCLEIYGCKETGRCVIQDDFQQVYEQLLACQGLMLASPIFFYTVSAHTKILMDRCQSLWVKKYWIDKVEYGQRGPSPDERDKCVNEIIPCRKSAENNFSRTKRKGLFISLGATQGKKLFEGPLLTVKYFFDVLDMELWKSLLYRGLDLEKDVLQCPDYLQEAYEAGKELALAIPE
jgi:hypothetical protein